MDPPIPIRNNCTPGPSVIIEDIHNMGPWSAGLSDTGYYNSWDIVFEFYCWWSKADKEVKPLVFNTSPPENHLVVALLKAKPRRKGMAAMRTGQKSMVHAIIPPENSDKEDKGEEEQQALKVKSVQKVIWSIKEMKCRSKRKPTLKSHLESDALDDEFYDSDSSEEDLSDDALAVGGGGKKTRPAKQTIAASKMKPKAARPSNRAKEQSALQVPPTPVKKPHRVGPASHMVDASKQTIDPPV
ncbi:hypothetical protein EDD22DRAFT_949752 [Suillus occidentalis]|nr:hypothetical protein EDD22DRAFT_949752 [Suillus occidentalis]